ncbi:hypothetical protein ACJRO7_016152 [Eucalyptus globulus]|uniref:Caffeoyl-CoA O-methyltransferase n=1 Tax=Eucalyptus globulus TaxID=34317 RepID=A0ABD3L6G2_EUCGL
MEPTAILVSEGPSGLWQSDELYNIKSLFLSLSLFFIYLCFFCLQRFLLLNEYVLTTSVYPREAEILKELRDAIANHPHVGGNLTERVFATAPDGGQFIALLLKLLNAKRTIEVGVFARYSLLLMALTILQDEAYEIRLLFIKKANVEHKIDFVELQALSVLDKLLENQENESSFDFAFVEADQANLKNYHERLLRLVWGGTVALADPSSAHPMWQFTWKDMIKFDKMIVGDPRVDVSQVALGDGMTICRRIY